MIDLEAELARAVQHFWTVRAFQHDKQGSGGGTKDTGNRGAVTGGKHADGFVRLIAKIVEDAGLPIANIHIVQRKKRTIPGYFRPTKDWDVVILSDNDLIAVIEVKSQVGSFGNNFNNRIEEALGNATDFWTAYKHGIYAPTSKPWVGYLFMLEEKASSIHPKKRIELHPFQVDEAFQGLSYAQRYEQVCLRLVREMLYDAACFLTSNLSDGRSGYFSQPNPELSIQNFAVSLQAKVSAYAKLKP
jgi:hypothetical protein